MTQSTRSNVRLVRHPEGDTHPVMGDPMRFIMTAQHTDGGYAISEVETRPGSGAPPHIHRHEDEAFYILEGTYTLTADGQSHQLSQGDYLHVPRGVVRSFENQTDQIGRMLILHSPGSASGFYIGMGKLTVPPKLEDIIALGEQYGIHIAAPGAGAK